jgi:predicted nuclease with RNAse H fold
LPLNRHAHYEYALFVLTVGIDLASQPERTAVCWIRWNRGCAEAYHIECKATDGHLIEAVEQADKVGIDVPFGWPDAFVKAVTAYAETGRWPTTAINTSKTDKPLLFRATDHAIRNHNPHVVIERDVLGFGGPDALVARASSV